MMELPKSLTAVVHVRFHYQEEETRPATASQIEMLDSLMNKASGLSPNMQEILVKFASYVRETAKKGGDRKLD